MQVDRHGGRKLPAPTRRQRAAVRYNFVPRNRQILLRQCHIDGIEQAYVLEVVLRDNTDIAPGLGTEDLDIYSILATIQQRNITFRELFAVPEHDRWVYKDGKSMVCDVFVLSMYKAGGLFGALTEDIQVRFKPSRAHPY